jgi:uncharacterized integral membrane protein (TIGR00698 family)
MKIARFLLPLAGLVCLTPYVSSALALALGIAIACFFGNPYLETTRKITHRLLALSVVGLGAGMDLGVVGRVGLQGIGYTIVGIGTTLLLGSLLGKVLKTTRDTSILITVGTAICGGSAIAAVAPAIGAKHHEVSVSLGTVFLLNALALMIFPFVGHQLHLTETQFGLWSALAIHDTSSVVGAAMQYGQQALQIATTVKLARALWIVPVTLAIGFLIREAGTDGKPAQKPKRPWFILGFIAAAALVTWVPALQSAGHSVEWVARRTLVLTLFLIGANLTPATLKSVGVRPLLQGVLLWICVASGTLGAICLNWIK